MKGKYTVKIKNSRVAYTLEIERNITIITGESGTGKTCIRRMVHDYEEYGKNSGVKIECKVPCHAIISDRGWEQQIDSIDNSIIFIDEGHDFIKQDSFAEIVKNSSNYFVLITRNCLSKLPYSTKSVLSLKQTVNRFNKVYSRTYPVYDILPDCTHILDDVDCIITEDSNAGYEMYKVIAEKVHTKCISANGKSNIPGMLIDNDGSRTLVIGDGAAFGPEIQKLHYLFFSEPDHLYLFLPECFEWVVLKSDIIKDKNKSDIIKNPSKYIESKSYFSWERFFTDYLTIITKGTRLQYNKIKLNKAYLAKINVEKFIAAMKK